MTARKLQGVVGKRAGRLHGPPRSCRSQFYEGDLLQVHEASTTLQPSYVNLPPLLNIGFLKEERSH
jgi:hypothetical protein